MEKMTFTPRQQLFMAKEVLEEQCPKHSCSMYKKEIPVSGEGKMKTIIFCPKCTEEKRDEENRAREIQLLKSSEKSKKLRPYGFYSEFPSNYSDIDTSNFEDFYYKDEPNLVYTKEILTHYLNEPEARHIRLYGSPLCGKSHFILGILKEIQSKMSQKETPLEDVHSMIYLPTPELFNILRGANKEEQRSFLKNLSKVDTLILDDFGSETSHLGNIKRADDWKLAILKELLSNQQQIITITKFKQEQLEEMYGDMHIYFDSDEDNTFSFSKKIKRHPKYASKE